MNWQPTLIGSSLLLRPLAERDFDSLFSAASDPGIWEQHPDRERHTRERFQIYFRSGIEPKGALVILDLKNGKLIGSSRFTRFNPETSSVEIGYTFLTREYWGGKFNLELKTLMLNYAFQFVENAYFVVGKTNLRSRKAMSKIGGVEVTEAGASPVSADLQTSVIYRIHQSEWLQRGRALLPFDQPALNTPRLCLEPITQNHAVELCELFSDSALHVYIPLEAPTLEQQIERCRRWENRRSPDRKELWLNWAGRENSSEKVIAHLQAGLNQDGVASIGYVVAREFQGKGLAMEALEAIFAYLRDTLCTREIKAWSDTRNVASHRLAKRMGMTQVGFIKDADHFKGSSSDEFVFSRVFSNPHSTESS